MSTAELPRSPALIEPEAPPLLHSDDRLDQPTFHRLYEATPEGFRAQLVEGVVHVRGWVTASHSETHATMVCWASRYTIDKDCLTAYTGPTLILGPRDEPEPDVVLLLSPAIGGQSTISDRYLAGAPEFVVEVACDAEAIDLHAKYQSYQTAGILEYLVVVLDPPGIFWYALREGRYEPIAPGPDGILRSRVFPGLWLDPSALVRGDLLSVFAALNLGLATPEHAAFVAKLEAAGGTGSP